MAKRFANNLQIGWSKKINCILRISIVDEGNSINFHDEQDIEKMLHYLNMSSCKSAPTPFPSERDLMSG